MTTESSKFKIVNRLGLHARAAAQLVQTANRFLSDVTIEKDGNEVNGNSRSYTKDTDMQFARELSKGFGGKSNGDRASAPKSYARKLAPSFNNDGNTFLPKS